MCTPIMPLLPHDLEPYGGATQRSRATLAPPKPLPWYVRNPLGALVAAVCIVMGGMLLLKFAELLGRI